LSLTFLIASHKPLLPFSVWIQLLLSFLYWSFKIPCLDIHKQKEGFVFPFLISFSHPLLQGKLWAEISPSTEDLSPLSSFSALHPTSHGSRKKYTAIGNPTETASSHTLSRCFSFSRKRLLEGIPYSLETRLWFLLAEQSCSYFLRG